jgi:curved DNA-binding protein CbpA
MMKSELERSKRVYSVLGLKDLAEIDEVKRAYRELALLHHPDKNPDDPSAVDRFREVNEAYQILSNPERKRIYDSTLSLYVRAPSSSGLKYAETTRSGLQEELNNFRQARRAATKEPASCQARSSYTKEQTELFKQREKEREAEMRKRLEKEREARREAEAEKSRRINVEKAREEERRRLRQEKILREKLDRIFDDKQAAKPSTPLGSGVFSPRTPPPPMNAREAQAGTRPAEFSEVPAAEAASLSPESPPEDYLMNHRLALERQRKERERQEEARLKEQEKFLERKLQEVREREEAKQRMRAKESETDIERRFKTLLMEEEQERYYSISPEENHERQMLLHSLRGIERNYHNALASLALSKEERESRSLLAAREIFMRVNLRFLGTEQFSRFSILSECQAELQDLTGKKAKELNRLHAYAASRSAVAMDEQSARLLIMKQVTGFGKIVELQLAEHKFRHFTLHLEAEALNHLASSRDEGTRRIVIFQGSELQRRKCEREEAVLRQRLLLEASYHRGLVMIKDEEVNAFVKIAQRKGVAMSQLLTKQELRWQQQVAELQKTRSLDREERNQLTVELSWAHQQLNAAKAEVELLRVTRETRPTPVVDQCSVSTQSDQEPIGADVEKAKDEMIAQLKSRLAQLESTKDSRELVSLLCAENKRLLETNARLMEENRLGSKPEVKSLGATPEQRKFRTWSNNSSSPSQGHPSSNHPSSPPSSFSSSRVMYRQL